MSSLSSTATCLILGVALGAAYFGGLWWSVNRGLRAPNPAAWLMTSALLRMALLLGCFRLVLYGGWQDAVACGCGVLLARSAITQIVRATS